MKPAIVSQDSAGDPVLQYAAAVVDGTIVAGPNVRNACRRHLQDLVDGPARGLRWDLKAAMRAISFFPDCLKLSQSFDGVPFVLESSQAFVVGSLLGWKRADGTRRFRRAFIEIGKGSGKSPLAAGLALYFLCCDGEMQGQVYSAASQKEQAKIAFNFALGMWRQAPELHRRLTPSGHTPTWQLTDTRTNSYFRPISTDEGKFSGPSPSFAICDEVHEHRDGSIIDMLEIGFKSRRQPMLLMITNSGSDRQSICWTEHVRAVQVAAGTLDVGPGATETDFIGDVIDDSQFSFVCGLDVGDDVYDEAVWSKANPLVGITLPITEMRRVIAQGKAIPGKLNGTLRLMLCCWTESEVSWMARAALEPVLHDFDPKDFSGRDVYCGLDLSATQDLTTLAYVVPAGHDAQHRPTFDCWVEAWTPSDTLTERAIRDKAAYESWVEQGWLQTTPGKVIGFDFVAARIAEIVGLYSVKALAYDSYGFNKHFEPELDALGLTLPIVEHPQGGKKRGAISGLWMPGSKMTLENLILEGRIRIRRSPVTISAMMSAAVESDPWGNSWFSKRKAVNRIDALVALAMAIGAATNGADTSVGLEGWLADPIMSALG